MAEVAASNICQIKVNNSFIDKERRRVRPYLFCVLIFLIVFSGLSVFGQETDIGPAGPKEVHIGPNVIIMPLDRVILARKDANYCVVKFIQFWTGKTEDDLYATYESYYQDDKTGDFTNYNVKYKKEKLISPKGIWIPLWHRISFGSNKEIKCGPIKLWWTGKGSVYFFERYQRQGDYGIELAPTPWTDISQVNVYDPRIKWYKYDGMRERINIPIDQLWEDKEADK